MKVAEGADIIWGAQGRGDTGLAVGVTGNDVFPIAIGVVKRRRSGSGKAIPAGGACGVNKHDLIELRKLIDVAIGRFES